MKDLWCEKGRHFAPVSAFRIKGQQRGKSGEPNVYLDHDGTYRAYAKTDQGRKYVGKFPNLKTAVAARDKHTTDTRIHERVCMACMGRAEKPPEDHSAMDKFLYGRVLPV